jgi:hypothetical protein
MTVEREQRHEPREESAELMLPAQLDAVTIVGPGGERAEAQIAERDRRSLVVAPLRAAKAELGDAPTDDLVLEFSTEQGRMRLHGSVELEDEDRMRFDPVESPEVLQEREYVRVPPVPPVSVQIAAGEDRLLSYAVNVSGGGILLAGPSSLKLGDELSLRLMTSQGAPPIQAIGVVVRADGESRRGICFKEISDGDRRRLVRFVFEVLREERQNIRNRSDDDAH